MSGVFQTLGKLKALMLPPYSLPSVDYCAVSNRLAFPEKHTDIYPLQSVSTELLTAASRAFRRTGSARITCDSTAPFYLSASSCERMLAGWHTLEMMNGSRQEIQPFSDFLRLESRGADGWVASPGPVLLRLLDLRFQATDLAVLFGHPHSRDEYPNTNPACPDGYERRVAARGSPLQGALPRDLFGDFLWEACFQKVPLDRVRVILPPKDLRRVLQKFTNIASPRLGVGVDPFDYFSLVEHEYTCAPGRTATVSELTLTAKGLDALGTAIHQESVLARFKPFLPGGERLLETARLPDLPQDRG